MTIGILERIAIALETLAANTSRDVITSHSAVVVGVEGAAAATPEVKKPARGRPAKITTEQKDAATTGETVTPPADDFLDTPAPKKEKPATLEDVRAALQSYSAKNGGGPDGTTKARALMTKSSSNGAVRLSIAKDVPGGDQGVLLVTDYAAVITAALA